MKFKKLWAMISNVCAEEGPSVSCPKDRYLQVGFAAQLWLYNIANHELNDF